MKGRGARIRRRTFLRAGSGAAALAALGGLPGCARDGGDRRRVIVLGIDGMSPHLLRRYAAAGRMPHFARLMRDGDFKPCRSSNPPQSPVAWSNFITGMNPGVHGLFDFIHRDPATLVPYFSGARAEPPSGGVGLGGWRLPLGGGGVRQLRRGPAFWRVLAARGIPATLYRMPTAFPPAASAARVYAGLGTPDIGGTHGIASYITDEAPPEDARRGGVRVTVVDMSSHACRAHLVGPENTYRAKPVPVQVPLQVRRDPDRAVARIDVEGRRVVLRAGEWSDWVRVRFPLLPGAVSVSGICRFYLKEVHPRFKLYVSPVNIDPADPALPLSTPPGFVRDLARDLGLFYTQGMAEDTKALSTGVFSDAEYRAQAMFVLGERLAAYEHLLQRFESGLLFFYFSTLDLNSHMFWRAMDPRHPLYTPALGRQHGKVLEDLYARMDGVLGKAMARTDERTTLIVLSDHGFQPFYRTFGVNGWLLDRGYARLRDPARRGEDDFFANTDWNRTRAYGLGINGLYLNLKGREAGGVVRPGAEARRLVDGLVRRLQAEKDPATGRPVVTRAYRREEIYRGPRVASAPDIVLGYHPGCRASWGTILGTYEREVLADNDDPWSGDHCMDVSGLDGVLLSNRKIVADRPALIDLAPTILAAFGVDPPAGTEGRAVLAPA